MMEHQAKYQFYQVFTHLMAYQVPSLEVVFTILVIGPKASIKIQNDQLKI
jgi:hypothetical protein